MAELLERTIDTVKDSAYQRAMPTYVTPLSLLPAHRGGARPGAGRKSKWPPGTAIKTMRFPVILEDELHQYAQKRMAEMERAQAQAAAQRAAGPPPEMKQVRMEKIDTRHYRLVHKERTIGDVSRSSYGHWLACLYGAGDHNLAVAEAQTRRGAVATLMSQERGRWRYDNAGTLYRDETDT